MISTFARRACRWRYLAVLVTGVLLGASVSALASHQFSDVPTSATYHAAVEWVFNRGITLGCAAGLYCPDDFVTRAQMALFMQRLGTALTPTVITRSDSSTATLDLDVQPVVCGTTADYTPVFPQRALIHAIVSIIPTAPLDFGASSAFSTNGGVAWSNLGGTVETRASDSTGHTLGFHIGSVDLDQGTAYRFGVRLFRGTAGVGTGDIAATRCAVHVEIFNRNPASSPLGGPGISAPQRRR